MIEENETFKGTWPYQARYFEGRGFRQHCVDEGSRDSAFLHEIWPEAPFITLPNVGHFAQEDAPGTLVSMIEQFVLSH